MSKKCIILSVLLTSIIFITLGVASILINKDEMLHIEDLNFYVKRATEIKENIAKIKDTDCQKILDAMMTRINETHFNHDVSLEDYYNAYYKDNVSFINFYEDAVKSCKIEDNLDGLYVLVLSSTNYPNEIKARYQLKHEVIIKDQKSRKDIIKTQDETGSYTTKALELQVINELVDKVKK